VALLLPVPLPGAPLPTAPPVARPLAAEGLLPLGELVPAPPRDAPCPPAVAELLPVEPAVFDPVVLPAPLLLPAALLPLVPALLTPVPPAVAELLPVAFPLTPWPPAVAELLPVAPLPLAAAEFAPVFVPPVFPWPRTIAPP
jgi:hypothetical protein